MRREEDGRRGGGEEDGWMKIGGERRREEDGWMKEDRKRRRKVEEGEEKVGVDATERMEGRGGCDG